MDTSPPTSAGRDFPLGVPGFTYQDLHREERLAKLHDAFFEELSREDRSLAERLAAWKADPGSLDPISTSRLLVEAARPVSRFVARLFAIESECRAQAAAAGPEAVLFRFRRDFLVRRAARTTPPSESELPRATSEARAIETGLFGELPWESDPELATARMGSELLDLEAEHIEAVRQKKRPAVSDETRHRTAELARRASAASVGLPVPADGSDEAALGFLEALLSRYAAWCRARLQRPELGREIAGWASFRLPGPIDYHRLVKTERPNPGLPEERVGPFDRRRRRDGFGLTDHRMTRREVLGETHYCILCHDRDKDSCAKGFFDEKTGTWQKNPLGIELAGCPLDEKISEMHQLRREGDSIGALALVAIDNPMCPGTGHRICNDCMKGCIYQKQDPVDIPQIETGVLTDVLSLPWGVEIYGLLTRWNPLSPLRPTRSRTTGRRSSSSGSAPRDTRSRTTW